MALNNRLDSDERSSIFILIVGLGILLAAWLGYEYYTKDTVRVVETTVVQTPQPETTIQGD